MLPLAVYLIHFAQPYYHAQHYVGYAADVEKRLAQHKSGRGARLLRTLNVHGIDYTVARVWPDGGKELERKIKRNKNARVLCPICRGHVGGCNNEAREETIT